MSTSSKVVRLDVSRSQQEAVKGVKLPALLIKLRDRCGEHNRKLLDRLFEQVDDSFFDLADKSATNSEQALFFDAMREIRLKKERIAALFMQYYNRDFQFSDAHKPGMLKANFDPQNLTLVQEDKLEEQVAIDNMVNRFKSEIGRDLEHLTIRLDSLLFDVSVEEENNPLGPQRMVTNFVTACAELDMGIRAKLVFFKLFEKHVLTQNKAVLEAANKFLAEQGVMPDLSASRSVRRTGVNLPHASGSVIDQNTGAVGEYNEGGWDPQIDPLQYMRQFSDAQMASAAGAAVNLPVVQQTALLNLLSRLQTTNKAPTAALSENGLINFMGLMERAVLSKEGQPRASVGRLDQDVMNLVTMLFEFILDDRQIPAAIRAVIARLQIPILKVALLDRTFFNQGGHSARRLLNEMATASIGWTEKAPGESDPFLAKLEEVVQRLVTEFDNDITIFDEVLEDFIRFRESDKKRRHLLEQRTRDAEVGRAKSDAAKKVVQDVLNDMLAGKNIPALVMEVLKEGWSNYMVLLQLKSGREHPDWLQAQSVAARLIQGCDPDDTSAEAPEVAAVDKLMEELRAGLQQTAYKPFELDKTLRLLQKVLSETTQQRLAKEMTLDDEDMVEVETLEVASAPAVKNEDAYIQAAMRVLKTPEPPVALRKEQELKPEAAPEQVAEVADVEQAEPVAQAPARIVLIEEDYEEPAVEVEADEDSLKLVDRLKIGTWVEINEGDDKKYRCKLVAIIQTTGKYIFVNRMGVKVAEKSRMGLAIALKSGVMSLLDDGLLFDRALESVIGTLRKETPKKS